MKKLSLQRAGAVYVAVAVVAAFFSTYYVRVGGAVVSILDGMLLLGVYGYGCFLLYCKKAPDRATWKRLPFALFALLIVYVSANNLYHGYAATAVLEFVQGTEFLFMSILVAGLMGQEDTRSSFVGALVGISAAVSAAVAAWYLAQGQVTNYKGISATRLLFGIPPLLLFIRQQAFEKKGQVARLFGWVALGVFLVVLLLSLERKAWAGFFAAAPLVYVAQRSYRRHQVGRTFSASRIMRAAGILVAGILILVPLSRTTAVSSAFSTLKDVPRAAEAIAAGNVRGMQFHSSSNQARVALLAAGARVLREHPVFGIGTDRFAEGRRAGLDERLRTFGIHNEYMRYAVENGLIAFALYTGIWLLLLFKAWRFATRAPPRLHYYALLTLGLTAYGAAVNVFLSAGALNTMFLSLAVGMVLGSQQADARSAATREAHRK